MEADPRSTLTVDQKNQDDFDFSFVSSPARIALYDDLLSSPRVIDIDPAPTKEFINNLASTTYNQAHDLGGSIPYTAVKQVAENFIHARFREIIVSIFDNGNTIRFSDQGPGISDKEAAQRPGFSSATEPMKVYIDGVGSGLPIVREYLDIKHGSLCIEDNLNGGSVVTLSLRDDGPSDLKNTSTSVITTSTPIPSSIENDRYTKTPANLLTSSLSNRGRNILSVLKSGGLFGVQEISNITDIPLSSTHSELKKLEESGFIEKVGKKRTLSELGRQAVISL